MDQIIITGAGGWLGKNFVRYLKGKYRLRCLLAPHEPIPEHFLTSSNVEYVFGDIRNPKSCETLFANSSESFLVHLAGVIHPKFVKDFYKINFEGTKNIVAAATEAGIKRAVIMSSNSPVGVAKSKEYIFDETTTCKPYMNYGKSKLLMEKHLQTCNLEHVIVRSPWFYGPEQPGRQTMFFKMVRDGKFPLIGDGQNLRSMAYVDNISQGIMKALFTPGVSHKTYWIADKSPYSMEEIISTIRSSLTEDFIIPCKEMGIKLPGFLSDIAYYMDYIIQSLGLYNQKVHVLSEMNKTIACSVELAKKELGYEPTISLREGIRRSIQPIVSTLKEN